MRIYINKIIDENPIYDFIKGYATKLESYNGHAYIGYPISNLDNKSQSLLGLFLIENKGIFCFTSTDENDFESKRYLDYLTAKDKYVYKNKGNLVSFIHLHNDLSDIYNYVKSEIDAKSNTFTINQMNKFSSIIQQTYSMQEEDNRVITKENSLGFLIKERNERYKLLDEEQFGYIHSKLHLHTRIRGLAGSGKTIIMVRKMAQIHFNNPEKVIVYSFYSKSLKEFITELFKKAYDELSSLPPNMEKVRIMHSWGNSNNVGVYREICIENSISLTPYRYYEGAQSNSFSSICDDALIAVKDHKQLYDYIFLDESQDFPLSFFRLCLLSLKPGGKMIYAYDELQNFNRNNMPTKKQIFLENQKSKDVNLDKCYRTPLELLVPAHAIGMGIYKGKNKLTNFIDDDSIWDAIGYKVTDGKLLGGKSVRLERKYASDEKSHLSSFEPLSVQSFTDTERQYIEGANFIKELIENEDIYPEDILIIDFDSLNFETNYSLFNYQLNKLQIKGSNIKVTSNLVNKESNIIFRIKSSIPYTSIYRAKGNEASIVLVFNAGHYTSLESYWRKQLFTAITRSKLLTRLYGIGEKIEELNSEIQKCKENEYSLQFIYPTEDEKAFLDTIAKKEQKTVEEIKKSTDIFQKLKKTDKNIALEMLMQQLGSDSQEELLEKIMELINDTKRDS